MKSRFETDCFVPHPLLWNGHLQTIIPARIKRKQPADWSEFKEITFTLYDDSEITSRYLIRDIAAPTLLILHGMAGSNQSRYVRGLVENTRFLGWNVFCPNMYDVSVKKKKPTVFHSGCSSLINDLLCQAVDRLNLKRVFLSGVSMGGNILLKMIGEWGSAYPDWVHGAAVISPLIDLPGSSFKLEQPSASVYRRRFVKKLKRSMISQAVIYQKYADLEQVQQARTLRQFDEAFTVPLSGFNSVDEYYATQSSNRVLAEIRIPSYIIHSKDDPVLTSHFLSSDIVVNNPELTVCLTEKGGHVGFMTYRPEGSRGRYWAENSVIDFLNQI
jgi:uncharacterized protein